MNAALVDRDPSWASYLEPALACTGHGLVTLTSGLDLLLQIRRLRPRVVIVDTSIDDYPPAILLPALRDLHPEVNVIVTSAYMTDDLHAILKDARPYFVMLKPVHRVTFLSIVADALGLPALVG